MEKLAKEHKPKLIISGAAHIQGFGIGKNRGDSKSVGAYHMSDIAHYAGLIAAGFYLHLLNMQML